MTSASAHFDTHICLKIRPRLTMVIIRAACLLFTSALLLVGNGKAAQKADQISDLTQRLQSQDSIIRRNAAYALGQIGAGAKEAVPALIAALKDRDTEVRRSAASALGQIGPVAKEAVPAL